MNVEKEPIKIGKRLRAQRRSLRMTLREVGAAAGCSESMVSKIEADKASPSLATLHRIVAALGTNMAHLFGDEKPCTVFRQGERPVINLDGQLVKLERLVPDSPDRLLQGSVELTVGNDTFRLSTGDSFVFRSEQEHYYRNTGDEPARLLWVNTPVTF